MKGEQYDPYLTFACELVTSIGDGLYKNRHGTKEIAFKGAVDLVTQFDEQSQKTIIDAIERRFPDHGILSEENVAKQAKGTMKWIIDPLDGTTNFAHGLPIWSLSIALEQEGETIIGAVYDPSRRELYHAQKGYGALCNNIPISVSRTGALDRSLLVTGFPYDIRETKENNLDHFSAFAVKAQAVRRLGSAALDLCYTACGRFDGYWELKLSPWDQAAGSLILQEAGGTITDFHGAPFSIYGNEVLASNGLIHGDMIRVLLNA